MRAVLENQRVRDVVASTPSSDVKPPLEVDGLCLEHTYRQVVALGPFDVALTNLQEIESHLYHLVVD